MARVAIVGENSIEYVSKLLDIWNNGDCAVLLDWRIPSDTLMQMMEEAGVTDCIIEKTIFNEFASTSSNINYIIYEKSSNSSEVLPNYIYEKYRENYSKDEAVVIYSSGTTGKAKGVILSHYAINTNADAIIDYMKPTPQDCIYIAKTISHSSTITGEILVALKSQMKLIIGPTIVPPRYVLNNVKKYGVTLLCINPTLLSMYSDELSRSEYNISSLKTIYVSGSILTNQVYEKARIAFKNIAIYNVYGLSEAGPRVTAQRGDCCVNNSVGKPLKNVEIVVVNEKGNVVNNGEYGIIHVKTKSVFNGYVIGEQKHISLYQNWYNTGDVGYIDVFGELHIVNRLDDVIVIDSHKIYPSEVEKYIIELTSVSECFVTKLSINNNDIVCCLYVGDIISEIKVKEKLKKKMMVYEIPKIFLKCDILPKNTNGKVSTNEIQIILKKHKLGV